MRRLNPAYPAGIFMALLWAVFLTLIKTVIGSGHFSVTGVNLAQRLITVAILFVPFALTPKAARGLRRRHWPYLLWVSVFFTLMMYLNYWAFSLYGQNVANSAILGRTDAIFAVVFGWLLLGERVRPAELLALAGMLAGVFLVTGANPAEYRLDRWAGDAAVILATLLVTANAFILRIKLGEAHNNEIALFNNGLSCAMLLAIYATLQLWDGTGLRDLAAFAAHPRYLILTILLGVVSAGVFQSYYFCLYRVPVWQLRAFFLFSPFFAVPIARLTPSLNETVTVWQIAGMAAMTGCGFWLLWMSRGRAAPERTPGAAEGGRVGNGIAGAQAGAGASGPRTAAQGTAPRAAEENA
jgi:drug/metabolite transporter (DMT)-like permease